MKLHPRLLPHVLSSLALLLGCSLDPGSHWCWCAASRPACYMRWGPTSCRAYLRGCRKPWASSWKRMSSQTRQPFAIPSGASRAQFQPLDLVQSVHRGLVKLRRGHETMPEAGKTAGSHIPRPTAVPTAPQHSCPPLGPKSAWRWPHR